MIAEAEAGRGFTFSLQKSNQQQNTFPLLKISLPCKIVNLEVLRCSASAERQDLALNIKSLSKAKRKTIEYVEEYAKCVNKKTGNQIEKSSPLTSITINTGGMALAQALKKGASSLERRQDEAKNLRAKAELKLKKAKDVDDRAYREKVDFSKLPKFDRTLAYITLGLSYMIYKRIVYHQTHPGHPDLWQEVYAAQSTVFLNEGATG